MKLKLYISSYLFFISSFLFAQTNTCGLISQTDALLQKRHIQPIKYSAQIYHEILNLYIESIDPELLYFSTADSNILHQHISKAKSLCDVFNITKPFIIERLKAHDSLVASLDILYFSNNQLKEQFTIPCEDIYPRQKDRKALLAYSKKYYKYLFIQKNYLLKEASLVVDRQKVLQAIIQKRRANLKELISGESQLSNLYITAICERYDPHSAFFDAAGKDIWDAHLLKDELSFGFEIELTENELYKITEIVPGGAAWNSKQIENGDFIDHIELADGKKYIVGLDTDKEIYEAIKSNNNNTITFFITKADGAKTQVKLTKAKIEVSNNVINGYIFRKNDQKLGYIDLPSFYSSNPGNGGAGCASDLAREILQLKKDSIEGLIIDLRNNGGGYLHEALSIAGLFIDEGILALRQERDDKPRYMKDPNRGTVYDGKLILLVNQFSASASELLAGTLQQYNRAVIVGNTTFGKATMQQVMPLDSIAETKQTNQNYVSITIGKFYMINKKTHQAKGIVPDIHLPSIYDYINSDKEADYQYALPADSVNKLVEVNLKPKINIPALRKNSENRTTTARWQTKLAQTADSVNFYYCNAAEMLLNQKTIFAWETSKNNFFKKLNQTNIISFEPYKVKNTSVYNQLLKEHEMYTKPNQFKIDALNKDIRLFETLNILADYTIQP